MLVRFDQGFVDINAIALNAAITGSIVDGNCRRFVMAKNVWHH
jgi:hypothetical protein